MENKLSTHPIAGFSMVKFTVAAILIILVLGCSVAKSVDVPSENDNQLKNRDYIIQTKDGNSILVHDILVKNDSLYFHKGMFSAYGVEDTTISAISKNNVSSIKEKQPSIFRSLGLIFGVWFAAGMLVVMALVWNTR